MSTSPKFSDVNNFNHLCIFKLRYFKNLAVGVLKECYISDQRRTILLLVRQMPDFGDTTLINMAARAENLEFIAHSACQTILTDIWTGKLSDENSMYLVGAYI